MTAWRTPTFFRERGASEKRQQRESLPSAELRERADGDALRRVRFLQGDCFGDFVDVIEIDAASNRGIDQIRELREMVRYAPAASRSKVVILDEAHMLTGEASNALLEDARRTPDRVIFVMAPRSRKTWWIHPSRSQHFHFRALTFAEIAGRLEEIAKKRI